MKRAKKRLPTSVVRDRHTKLVIKALEIVAYFEENKEEIFQKIRDNIAARFAVEPE